MARRQNKQRQKPPAQAARSATGEASRPLPTSRETRPAGYSEWQGGGLSPIPRRSLPNPGFLALRGALSGFHQSSPLRLLSLLIDVDPDVALALDNCVSLICAPDQVQIVAETPGTGSHNAAPDDGGTADIQTLLEAQPPEVGGLRGLMEKGVMLACVAGLNALEAVPGPALTGVRRLWPTDPFSLAFARESADGDVIALQAQSNSAATSGPLPGYVRLNPETFFWLPWQTWVDDPNGRAWFAPALAEVLFYLAMLQDVRDSVHSAAHPRLKIGFNWSETMKIVKEVLGEKDHAKATAIVQTEWDRLNERTRGMKSDDAIITDTNGTADILDGGSFQGLEPILTELRDRVRRGCKQLPVMMGFTDGGATEGHTGVQWMIQAARLESLRDFVLQPILKACSLHLRLLGKALVARARVQRIRTTDALIDAQTEALALKTGVMHVLLGFKSLEQVSIETTGSGLIGAEPSREELLKLAGIGPKGDSGGANTAGSPREEQQAQQDAKQGQK